MNFAKLKPGDRVAILSLSGGLPEVLPLPFELGLKRLREDFSLVPVEYPTTRVLRSSPADRAADLHAAFADPTVRAVMATIGGSDQLTVLPHLDAALLRANPKPFFGSSDNTNLLAYLASIGVGGYHGGSVMVHLGRPGGLHPQSTESLRAALFDSGPYELTPATRFTDLDGDWTTPSAFLTEVESFPGDGWVWHNAGTVASGPSWGGCVEVLAWLLMANRCIPSSLDGAVLMLETSEEMPRHKDVYTILRSMGERGLLAGAAGVMVARPKASNLTFRASEASRRSYVEDQKAAGVACANGILPVGCDGVQRGLRPHGSTADPALRWNNHPRRTVAADRGVVLMLTTALPEVVLRPLTVSDAEAYHALLTSNRAHLTRHGNFVEETAWSLETVRSSVASCTNHAFGIWRDGVLLGRVDLVPVDPPKYGLGYLLATSATGQGVATESVRAVVGWAREVLLAEAVFAGVTHGNRSSVAVLERLGFFVVQEFESYTRFRLCFT